jgi:hypothetical protein
MVPLNSSASRPPLKQPARGPGDLDPLEAVRLALGHFAADEIVISTLPRGPSQSPEGLRWYSNRGGRSLRELAPLLVLLLGWGDRWANDQVPVVLEYAPDGEPHTRSRRTSPAPHAGTTSATRP